MLGLAVTGLVGFFPRLVAVARSEGRLSIFLSDQKSPAESLRRYTYPVAIFELDSPSHVLSRHPIPIVRSRYKECSFYGHPFRNNVFDYWLPVLLHYFPAVASCKDYFPTNVAGSYLAAISAGYLDNHILSNIWVYYAIEASSLRAKCQLAAKFVRFFGGAPESNGRSSVNGKNDNAKHFSPLFKRLWPPFITLLGWACVIYGLGMLRHNSCRNRGALFFFVGFIISVIGVLSILHSV